MSIKFTELKISIASSSAGWLAAWQSQSISHTLLVVVVIISILYTKLFSLVVVVAELTVECTL